jgi:hypothetical protein
MNSAKIKLTCFLAGTLMYLSTPAGATLRTPGMPDVSTLNSHSVHLALNAYQPAIPKPGFYGALAIGLAAIVCATTRRNKQRVNQSV